MSREDFDVLVIGAGPGGYVCAIRCAQLGMKVGLVEKNPRLGGTCLNVGCIPSKALLHSTEVYHELIHGAQAHGIVAKGISHDLSVLMQRKDKVVDQLGKGVSSLVKAKGATILSGMARLLGEGQVEVTESEGKTKVFKAKEIVLATGSKPTELPFLPFDGKVVVSSDQGIALERVPKKLVVVGGGAIGLELGCVWSRLGAEVTVVEFLSEICPQLDPEVAKTARKILEKQGLRFMLSTKVSSAQVTKTRATLSLDGPEGQSELSVDRVLVAVGRGPFTDGLGLEEVGLQKDERGRVSVNQSFQTNVTGIRAIGDLIHGPMLAHKAEEDGVACAEILAGQAGHVDYSMVPGVIYVDPEIANVGMSESMAKDRGIAVSCGSFPLAANGRALATGCTDGLVKVVADKKTDQLLGVQVVARSASELIASAVAHMEYGGSAEDLARTIHAHPTLSESLKEAALGADGRGLHSL
ncbi:MAG: dihydrolipoyl dehydrogenase [Verrucomicrobiota bacterium]|nr:dihydrolipoyl dehydrogenase [Verrucomicrobiota bacterium]MEC8657060.1 dihydrolipoyl dehydrogenase [Verrucomicrobiota bacterium]